MAAERAIRTSSSPRQALRGGIQKSIFKHISGNRGTSRPKVDKSAPMAPETHLRYPHEGSSVDPRLQTALPVVVASPLTPCTLHTSP